MQARIEALFGRLGKAGDHLALVWGHIEERVGDGTTGSKLRIKIHIGAPSWVGGPGISFQVQARFYQDVTINQQSGADRYLTLQRPADGLQLAKLRQAPSADLWPEEINKPPWKSFA